MFVDFENLACGAGASLPSRPALPEAVLARVCGGFYGQAAVRRAYADWAHLGNNRFQGVLMSHGVDLVQVPHGGVTGKNHADVRMAVDAMEVLATRPGIDVFVLVTGDSDLTPLAHRLREHGKHIVGVGARASSSPLLVAACSDYLYWENLAALALHWQRPEQGRTGQDPGEPARTPGTKMAATIPPTAAPAPAPAPKVVSDLTETGAGGSDRDVARALLRRALAEDGVGGVKGAALKQRMLRLDPSFDHKRLGTNTFRAFLEEFPDLVRIVSPRTAKGDMALVPVAAS